MAETNPLDPLTLLVLPQGWSIGPVDDDDEDVDTAIVVDEGRGTWLQ